jgi:hypothetical protein
MLAKSVRFFRNRPYTNEYRANCKTDLPGKTEEQKKDFIITAKKCEDVMGQTPEESKTSSHVYKDS